MYVCMYVCMYKQLQTSVRIQHQHYDENDQHHVQLSIHMINVQFVLYIVA